MITAYKDYQQKLQYLDAQIALSARTKPGDTFKLQSERGCVVYDMALAARDHYVSHPGPFSDCLECLHPK